MRTKAPATAAVVALCALLASCGGSGVGDASSEDEDPPPQTVSFSVAGGVYESDQIVYLSTMAGAVIHYTIDDPDISAFSATYANQGIPVSGDGTSAVIRALASLEGYPDSSVSTATYEISYSWHDLGPEGFNGRGASCLDVAVSPDGTPYVAYNDTTDIATSSLGQLFVAAYSGGSWEVVGSALSAGGARCPDIAFDAEGTCHVAFIDTGASNAAFVKKLEQDGQTWSSVGAASMPSVSGFVLALAFAPGGTTPYVFLGAGGKVIAFIDGAWQLLGGSSVLSASYASEGCVAASPDGKVYAAYVLNSTGKASVMEYSGDSWSFVGAGDFTPDEASSLSLGVDPSGAPCLSFLDCTDNERYASLMRHGEGGWDFVGGQGFSPSHVYGTSLAFDPLSGNPVVGIIDGYAEASVMRYAGGAWSMEGSESFSDPYDDDAYMIKIAIDGSGRICAAYQDWSAGYGVTVKRR